MIFICFPDIETMIFHFWVSSREPSQIFHSDSGFDEKLAAKSVSHEPSFLPVKQNLDWKTSHFNYRYVTISQKSKFNSESQSYCQTQSLQYEGDLMDPRNSELGFVTSWFILHAWIEDLIFNPAYLHLQRSVLLSSSDCGYKEAFVKRIWAPSQLS